MWHSCTRPRLWPWRLKLPGSCDSHALSLDPSPLPEVLLLADWGLGYNCPFSTWIWKPTQTNAFTQLQNMSTWVKTAYGHTVDTHYISISWNGLMGKVKPDQAWAWEQLDKWLYVGRHSPQGGKDHFVCVQRTVVSLLRCIAGSQVLASFAH